MVGSPCRSTCRVLLSFVFLLMSPLPVPCILLCVCVCVCSGMPTSGLHLAWGVSTWKPATPVGYLISPDAADYFYQRPVLYWAFSVVGTAYLSRFMSTERELGARQEKTPIWNCHTFLSLQVNALLWIGKVLHLGPVYPHTLTMKTAWFDSMSLGAKMPCLQSRSFTAQKNPKENRSRTFEQL